MNIILFTADEIGRSLPFRDPRAEHLLKVLKLQPGDSFDLGLVNGPRGKGRITSVESGTITWHAEMETKIPEIFPLYLLMGAVRPPAARRILKDAATLGLEKVWIFPTEKGEPSYIKSGVWEKDTVSRLFLEGAAQGFTSRLPELRLFENLRDALEALPDKTSGFALDNYEALCPLAGVKSCPPVALAVGSERGWSAAERDLLRASDFTLASLGPRVLRSETAVVAASAIILSQLGYW
ncbi:MAG: 16S rRNA (uracil(1498)-N(3))-methyltransferase [Spirochaetales bacterium]|nr:16S rRNA (uracil(1498)-N(3))-methyltransferase [Spirochaetales bacterium]